MLRACLLLAACTLLAAADEDKPVAVMGGAKVDPAVLAPLTAPGVPWEAGDRILIVGDLLGAPGQPELAVRIHEALAAGRPDLGITVGSLMNHGITIEKWRDAAKAEISRHPPHLVVICAGIGDVAATDPKMVRFASSMPVSAEAQAAKGTATAPEAWRNAVAEMIGAAQAANAMVVLATPAVFGDKPADGFGFKELEAYADAARNLAAERKIELCELRKPLLEVLAQKNPKGSREIGVLSRTIGQLRPEAMDLVAGLLARSMAAAAARIPWRIEVPDATFAGGGKGEVRLKHAGRDQVTIRYTDDGSEPTADSAVYGKPLAVDRTIELRALAVDKDGAKRSAAGWIMAVRSHAAEASPPETVPGVWAEHVAFPAWIDPAPPIEDLPADFAIAWPNCETSVCYSIPNHRYPEVFFGLRFTGYFLAPSDGIYVFATDSDDTTRLVIDGLPILKCDLLHAPRRAQGAIELNRGLHPFSLVYGQGSGPYSLAVSVALPGQRLARLPDLLLRRTAAPPKRKAAPEAAAAKPDPAALAPLTAGQVPWEAGDRILIVGDLLCAADQPELALRLQQALAAGRPDQAITVFSLMNHGLTTEQWRDAAKAEMLKRKPELVVVMTGVGDVLKGAPISADAYRAALAEMIKAAQAAGAAVVVSTPAICGDKPADGPGGKELDAYAEAARKLAGESKVELCDLRKALLAALAERNPKAAESGVLSQAPGRLLAPGMDIVAGQIARAMASAALRIPWSIEVPETVFGDSGKAEVRLRHGTPSQVAIFYTTDGRDPTEKSPLYTRPVGVGSTVLLKALAVAKEKDGGRQSASGWIMKTGKAPAEAAVAETLPGLWVDHYWFRQWRDPIPPLDSMKPDFTAWWPNAELEADSLIPTHRWPEENFGLRFTGLFLAPVDGTYVFSTDSDDSTRLTIGASTFIKNDDLHAARAEENAIELGRGLYPIKLLYGQGPGQILCDVRVGLAGQRLQPLPDLLLRRPQAKPKKKEVGFEVGGDKDEDKPPAK